MFENVCVSDLALRACLAAFEPGLAACSLQPSSWPLGLCRSVPLPVWCSLSGSLERAKDRLRRALFVIHKSFLYIEVYSTAPQSGLQICSSVQLLSTSLPNGEETLQCVLLSHP